MKQSKLIVELHKLAANNNLSFNNLKDSNTVIICGAGISIESKLPSGWNIIEKILNTFNLGNNSEIDLIKKFQKYNSDVISNIQDFKVKLYDFPRLEVLFKCLKDILTVEEYHLAIKGFLFYNYKENSYNQKIFSNYQHFAIADFIKNNGTVLTANFDNLLEHALEELDNKNECTKINFPLNYKIDINKKIGTLIKYHGDINEIETIGIDISNLRINGFNDIETNQLDSIFDTISNVIFIGFSVSDTLDLVPYLRNLKNEIEYFYFNFTSSINSSIEEFKMPNKGNLIEAYEYFFTKNEKCYIVNSNNNEIQKKANPYKKEQSEYPAFQLNKNEIEKMKNLINLLTNQNSINHIAIKNNILKAYGLLNLYNIAEINLLPKSLKNNFIDYVNNINGNYKYNFYELLKNKQQKDYEHLKFGAMQEFVFLQKGYSLDRFARFFELTYLFFKLRSKLKKTQNNLSEELKLNRNISLYKLRIFQSLSKKKLSFFIPKTIINEHNFLILRQIDIAKQLNNLQIYKYALKEHLYIKAIFQSHFKISKIELNKQLLMIYEMNIDTNFFIDANNILRFGAEKIDSKKFKKISKLSSQLTNDYLNLSKIK